MQAPESIIMIRPKHFGFNLETSSSNAFQNQSEDKDLLAKAIKEFDEMLKTLQNAGIDCKVFDDNDVPVTPDSIFPNNWFSTHRDGHLVIYPMAAKNRQAEIRPDVIEFLKANYHVKETIDLSPMHADEIYLEGTGSIVFDHITRTAYACESPRTNVKQFTQLCAKLGYLPISFLAQDLKGQAIYHTNVLLSVGSDIVIICSDSISDPVERKMTLKELAKSKKVVIDVDFKAMNNFACNAIELRANTGESILAISSRAWDVMDADHKFKIERYLKVLPISIPTIEEVGGGSVRCMIAGVHFKSK